MKTSLSLFLATLVMGTAAFAGGPVVVVEEEEVVVEEQSSSSTGILPLLLIPVALCVVLCGGDGDPEPDLP
jgi:hypothetical protein